MATRLFYHKGLTLQVQIEVQLRIIADNYARDGASPVSTLPGEMIGIEQD
jgi:hypothetical protein